METVEYFFCDKKEHWLNQIGKSDWVAGRFLYNALRENKLKSLYGEKTEVLLLTDSDRLISFCTYSDRDNIPDTSLTPWIGFVYTFPEHRGKRRIGKLLELAYLKAKKEGHESIYLSTNEIGLYEKYGFSFLKVMKDEHGEDNRVYKMDIASEDYSKILGRIVKGKVDRPIGSTHPAFPDMVYPINYGYVESVFAPDGEEQDAYIFGTDKPIDSFSGKVVGVIHRLNDCEVKWIVNISDISLMREEILDAVSFQEQYFMGELYM